MVIASIAFGFSLNLGYRATEKYYTAYKKVCTEEEIGEGGESRLRIVKWISREKGGIPLSRGATSFN